ERDGRASFGSGHDRPRVHRLRQGQSRQAQHGVGWYRKRHTSGGRAVQDHGRRRHGSRSSGTDRSRKNRSTESSALAGGLVKGGGAAWLDGNVSSRSGPIYNHAVDRSRESGTFSVLS